METSMKFRSDHMEFLSCKMLGKNQAICRQVQAKTSVRMHLVMAYVMPHPTATIENKND